MSKDINKQDIIKKGDAQMIRTMTAVPLLKDETADAFFTSLKKSKLKPYTEKQKEDADKKIKEIISKGIMK